MQYLRPRLHFIVLLGWLLSQGALVLHWQTEDHDLVNHSDINCSYCNQYKQSLPLLAAALSVTGLFICWFVGLVTLKSSCRIIPTYGYLTRAPPLQSNLS